MRAAGPGRRRGRRAADDLDGDWSGLIVFCGGTSWDGNKFPDQHMAERLARYSPVLYVDPPISHLTVRRQPELAASLRPPRLRRLGPRLARLTPLAPPGKGRPGIRGASEMLWVRSMRRAVRSLGATVDTVVVASLAPLADAFPHARYVVYGTDDFVAGAALMGISEGWLHEREQEQLRRADAVVAISPVLAEKWRMGDKDVVVVANGCDAGAFSMPQPTPSDVSLPHPIAGFVGHLSARIDLRFLEAVAARRTSLLLIGPRQETFAMDRMNALLAQPNVVWLGARPFDSLPPYVGLLDVGLVPYADSEFNRASFPLKTLEYLAAGKAVVSTDLPAVRGLETPLIAIRSDPEEFADAVDEWAAAPPDVTAVARRRALAAEHSWDRRAAEFAAVLGLER